MDFEVTYTEEQQRFRREVRAWLEGTCRRGSRARRPRQGQPGDRYQELRAFGRQLGDQRLALPARTRAVRGRRARRRPHDHPGGGGRSRRSLAAAVLRQRRAARLGHDPRVGHRGAEAGVPAADLPGRRADLAAPDRARRRLRPRGRDHHGHPRRRRVRHQRAEDLRGQRPRGRPHLDDRGAPSPAASATRTSPGS